MAEKIKPALGAGKTLITEPMPPPKPGEDLIKYAILDWDMMTPEGAPAQDDIFYGTVVDNRSDKGIPNIEDDWKPVKNRVFIASVLYPMIGWQAYIHHMNFMYRCGRRNPDYEFIYSGIPRLEIDRARNRLASTAIQMRCEYLYFYDTDTHMPPDLMTRMLEVMKLDENIVGCSPLYHIRGYPFRLMAFKGAIYDSAYASLKEVKAGADENGLYDVEGLGCGTTMTRVSAYTGWNGPWYRTSANHTEDAWFCSFARKFNPKARFVIDTTMECGHELIDPPVLRSSNVKQMKKMFGPKGWFRRDTE